MNYSLVHYKPYLNRYTNPKYKSEMTITVNYPEDNGLIVEFILSSFNDVDYLCKIPYFCGQLAFDKNVKKEMIFPYTISLDYQHLLNDLPHEEEALILYFDLLATETIDEDFWNEKTWKEAYAAIRTINQYFFPCPYMNEYEEPIHFPFFFHSWLEKKNLVYVFPCEAFMSTYLKHTPSLTDTSLTDMLAVHQLSRSSSSTSILFTCWHDKDADCYSPRDDEYLIETIYNRTSRSFPIIRGDEDIHLSLKNRVLPLYELANLENVAITGGNLDVLCRNPNVLYVYAPIQIFFYNLEKKEDAFILKLNQVMLTIQQNRYVTMLYDDVEKFIVHVCGYIYHIYKKQYSSLKEVLASQPLDSECIAYAKENKNVGIFFNGRYRFAYYYQMNIIRTEKVTNCSNYNSRLYSAYKQGYNIYVPGALHLKHNYFLPLLKKRDCLENYRDTLYELIMQLHHPDQFFENNYHNGSSQCKLLIDYDEYIKTREINEEEKKSLIERYLDDVSSPTFTFDVVKHVDYISLYGSLKKGAKLTLLITIMEKHLSLNKKVAKQRDYLALDLHLEKLPNSTKKVIYSFPR